MCRYLVNPLLQPAVHSSRYSPHPALLFSCIRGDLQLSSRSLLLAITPAVADQVVVDAAAEVLRPSPAQEQSRVRLTGDGAETRRRRRRHVCRYGDGGGLAALHTAGERLDGDGVVGERLWKKRQSSWKTEDEIGWLENGGETRDRIIGEYADLFVYWGFRARRRQRSSSAQRIVLK